MKRRNTRRADSRRQDRYDEMPQRRHREELYQDDFGYDDEDIDDASFRRNVHYGQPLHQRRQNTGFREQGFGYRDNYGQQGYQGQRGRWNDEGGSGYGHQGYQQPWDPGFREQGLGFGVHYGYPQYGQPGYGFYPSNNPYFGQAYYPDQMSQYYNGPQRYAGAGYGYNEIQGHGNRWENQNAGQWNPQQSGSGYGQQGFREQGSGNSGYYGQQGYGQHGYGQQGYGQPNREHADQFWGAGDKREEDSERQSSQDPYRSQQNTSLSAQGAPKGSAGEDKNQWKQHTSTGNEQREDQRREEETPNMGLRTPSPTDENKNKKK